MFNSLYILSSLAMTGSSLSGIVNTHGYSSVPMARQVKCYKDGGFWHPIDGSRIPNSACKEAFQRSGTYQFTQKHEVSANVEDHHNIENVKRVIRDGTLCAAGDSRKAGMDVISRDWYKSNIEINEDGIFNITIKFCATAAHNPSYWEIYITKEGYDSGTQALTWNDLIFIKKLENILPKSGAIADCEASKYYELDINNLLAPVVPDNDQIIYLRWQRHDPANEGFYNCIDVNFILGQNIVYNGDRKTLTSVDTHSGSIQRLCQEGNSRSDRETIDRNGQEEALHTELLQRLLCKRVDLASTTESSDQIRQVQEEISADEKWSNIALANFEIDLIGVENLVG